MKYLFIAKKFPKIKRGAWTASEDLRRVFPNNITLKTDNRVHKIRGVAPLYDKIVLVTQVPHLYHFAVNFLSLHGINHLIFIRSEHNEPFFNSCTNGFYYYKEHEDIKNYIPFIPRLPVMREPQEERIGFYHRPYLNPDACKWFIDKYKDNDIPIITMGEYIAAFKNRRNWVHTYERDYFWKNTSTYLYPRSTTYVDPFPTSVVEALQTGKKVLIHNLGPRNYKDGIDDVLDVCNYDRNLFNFSNFVSYYRNLLSNGMESYIDRYNYNTLSSYLLSII